jgi:hypothetical protein
LQQRLDVDPAEYFCLCRLRRIAEAVWVKLYRASLRIEAVILTGALSGDPLAQSGLQVS